MRETIKVSSTKPAKRIIWKVTICRVGTGCQLVEYDAILKHCWRKLVHNDLNKPYITGVNPSGQKFGEDFTAAFESCFAACKRRIWRKEGIRYVEQTEGDVRVSIHRYDNVEDSYE